MARPYNIAMKHMNKHIYKVQDEAHDLFFASIHMHRVVAHATGLHLSDVEVLQDHFTPARKGNALKREYRG